MFFRSIEPFINIKYANYYHKKGLTSSRESL